LSISEDFVTPKTRQGTHADTVSEHPWQSGVIRLERQSWHKPISLPISVCWTCATWRWNSMLWVI